MKAILADGTEIHKLGDLRIAGPREEVNAFLAWLENQACSLVGAYEMPAVKGIKAVDIAINLFPQPPVA